MKNIVRVTTVVAMLLVFSQFVFAEDSQRGVSIKGKEPQVELAIEGNYWALIIGINRYANLPKEQQLSAAKPDAEAIADVLQTKYGFAQDRIITLYDDKATRKEILKQLRALALLLKDKDNLLIYYAGHGQYEKETQLGGWIPSDAEFDDPSTWVTNAEVRDRLGAIKARHVFTLADSCFSESLMGKTRSLGAMGEFAIKELYNSKSRWILTSGGYYPVPDKSKGSHSTFAYYLLKILGDNDQKYLTPQQILPELQRLVSNDETNQTPKGAPITSIGDEGGQFVFVLAYAKTPSLEDLQSKESASKIGEERKQLEQDKAKMVEDIRKMKEQALQEVERELREKSKQHEQERVAKDKEQQELLGNERRRLDQEKQEVEKEKQKKADAPFVPPTF